MIVLQFYKERTDEKHTDSMLYDAEFVDRIVEMIRWWIIRYPNGRICYSNPAEMRISLQELQDRQLVALMESFL